MGNEIYPEFANFTFEMNKKDLHITPVYINRNISYRISYKCLECNRENVYHVRCDYSFVPKFKDILSRIRTPCLCKKSLFTQAFHGVTYHIYPDIMMRYTLVYQPEKVSRVYLIHKGKMSRVYDPVKEIKPRALDALNSCIKIKNSLPQWIESFKMLDDVLLRPETNVLPKSNPTVNVKLGDVYYSQIKSICGHHFYRVISVKSNEIEIQCTECEQKKCIFKSTFADNYKFAYHSNITNTTKIPQKKVEAPPKQSISKKKISFVDVIVLSTSRKCSEFNHTLIDYIGVLPVYTNDQCKNLEINISYCKQCSKYIMLTTDYTKINGSPICEVRDQTTGKIYNKGLDIFGLNSTESVLHSYGYNVRSGNGLSSMDRRNILINVLKNGVCSKSEIISHLEYCINMASSKSNMAAAIHKWESDIQFVREYKTDAEKVAIGSITLKYNKPKG